MAIHAGNVSGSSTSTGSFGHIIKGGVNWNTAVSASAATAGFGSGGGGGGSDNMSWSDGTATLISGSSTSTGSFGAGGLTVAGGDFDSQVITRKWDLSTISLDKYMQDGSPEPEWGGNSWDLSASPDGLNVYVSIIGSSDTIIQYKLSGSWDIGSVSSTQSASFGSQDSMMRSMAWYSDGTKLITMGTGNDKFYQYSLSTPWDITTRTYVRTSTLYVLSACQGIEVRPDGLRLYSVHESDYLSEYEMTEPMDISTMTLVGTYSLAAQGTGDAYDVFFRGDGRYAYLFEKDSKYLCEWKLSTPWAFSTATYTGNNVNMPNNIKMTGNPEGTRLWGLDYSNDRINQYSWNGGTDTYNTGSIDIIGKTGIHGDVTVAQTLEVYGKLKGYSAEFKGDVSSSITSTGSFGHIMKSGVNWDTAVSASAATAGFGGGGGGGSSFTAAGISGSWQSYTLISGSGQIATQISGAFTSVSSSLASRITTREAFTTQSFSDGTSTTISGSVSSTGSFGHIIKGGVNWDTAVSASAATAGFGSGGGGGGGTITALNNATANELVTIGSTTTELDAESNLTFDGSTLTVTGDAKVTGDIIIDDGGSLKEAGGTAAITFDGSGHVTKIGQASPSSDEVLTWDGSKWASAAVTATVTGGTGMTATGTTLGGIVFKSDSGLTGSFSDTITISTGSMYVTSASLITPSISSGDIDITTAVHIKGSKDAGYTSGYGFDGGVSISSNLYDLYFSPDGRKLFVLDGHSSRTIYSFELKTPWDIATQQYILKKQITYGISEQYPQGFTMHPDGTYVYFVGNTIDGISEFALTIPWDLTTMTVGKSIDLDNIANRVASESAPKGIDWKPDGTKVYIVGQTTDAVLQYAVTGSGFDIHSLSFEYQLDVPTEETYVNGIKFKQDGSQMFIVGTTEDEIYQYNLSKNWDISSARFVNSFSVSSEEPHPHGLFLKPDDSGFYVAGTGGDEINEYKFTHGYVTGSKSITIGASTDIYGDVDIKGKLTLQQPWANDFKTEANFNHGISSLTGSINVSNISNPIDITTAVHIKGSKDAGYTYDYGFDGNVSIDNAFDLYFSPDGRKLFVLYGQSSGKIYSFELKTPWDVLTQQYLTVQTLGTETQPFGMAFHPDGTKVYFVGSTIDGITEFTLPIPWDLTTMTVGKSIDLDNIANRVASESTPYGIDWKPDGTKVYVVGNTTKSVLQYAVTGSAFDIGSLSLEYQLDVPIEESWPTAVRFKQDGSQMFIVGNQKDEVIQYNLSKNWDMSTARVINVFSVSSEENYSYGLFLKPDNSGFYIIGSNQDEVNEYKFQGFDTGSYSQKLTIGASTDIYGDVDIKGKLTLQQPWANDFKTEANFNHGISSLTGSINVSNISNPIDITTAVYKQTSADPATIGDITDIYFKPDGKVVFLSDDYNVDKIYQYTLSTPWDISTLNTAKVAELSVSSQESNIYGFTMSIDGYWLFVVGSGDDGINSYNLTTPWDISTASAVKSINIGTVNNAVNEDYPYGIDWKPDGTKVYVVGTTTDAVLQYAVTGSAFDIGSLSFEYQLDVPIEETYVYGIKFKQDGSQMFIVGSTEDEIYQYNLSKNWDISSARFVNSFSVSSEESGPNGMFFKPDDSGFYVVGTGGEVIDEYTLGDSTTGRTFRDSRITGSASTLDMAGQVNLFGSLDVLQDINVLGHISQSSYSTASLGHTIATSFAGDGASLTNVPDYVYDSTYVLQTISELETFVTENKHLPNVPDMNDMDKWKILSVSDRDMLLLEKIEELSLYIIQLNKRIEDLENK